MSASAPDLTAVLARAERLCASRGVRLTPQRRRVLAVICGASRPLGAYEILDLIRDGAPAAPPTVYRALEFLLAQGLVHRLATQHTYVGCADPEHPHASQFLICTDCGGVQELCDDGVAGSLRGAAAASGFRTRQPVVEVIGTCAQCASNGG